MGGEVAAPAADLGLPALVDAYRRVIAALRDDRLDLERAAAAARLNDADALAAMIREETP